MEPQVWVALIGTVGTVVCAVIAALVNKSVNKEEKVQAVDDGVERVLRERLELRDDVIDGLRAENADLRLKLADSEAARFRVERILREREGQ